MARCKGRNAKGERCGAPESVVGPDSPWSGADPMEHCNARTKGGQNGRAPAQPGPWAGEGYCKRAAGWGVPETTTGRCKYHGGASLKGAGHPRATDLRHSKYVPKWLADDYEASLRRADQLALDDQIATIDARIAEVWRDMPEGAGADLWLEAKRAQERFEAAERTENRAAAERARGELSTALTGGAAYSSSWDELCRLGELRRRLTATEATRRHQVESTVTRSRLASLVVFMAEGIRRAINENVSSQKERRRALTQMSTFMHGLALAPGREPIEIHTEDV